MIVYPVAVWAKNQRELLLLLDINLHIHFGIFSFYMHTKKFPCQGKKTSNTCCILQKGVVVCMKLRLLSFQRFASNSRSYCRNENYRGYKFCLLISSFQRGRGRKPSPSVRLSSRPTAGGRSSHELHNEAF